MPTQNNPVLSAIDYGVTTATNEIAVYFAKDGERFDISVNEGDWTAYEQETAMAALEAYAAVADLTFHVTADAREATFTLTKSETRHGSLGYMNLPDPAYGDAQGIAWFNSLPFWGDENSGMLDPGSYTFSIFLHEFGHGLGLAHPFEESGASTVMPPVGPGLGLDQGVFTVMSYNDGWPEAPEGSPDSYVWGWNLGPSPIDIAVIQQNYGANTTTARGNDTYVLASANEAGTGYLALWDTGGTDTIKHSGDRAALIDLRAATLLPEAGGGGFVSHASGIHGGFTIAHGVVIEQAVGGAGNDTLVGNDAANVLNGRGGADEMAGGGGDDTYFLDRGGDRVVEDAGGGFDTIVTSARITRLADHANVEKVRLIEDAGAVIGSGAADEIVGNDGDNVLKGRGGGDTLDGRGGADRLVGQRGDDVYILDGDDAIVERARGGHDRIETRAGDVDLRDFANVEDAALLDHRPISAIGSAAANHLTGNTNRNTLDGLGGNDTLEGGAGRDALFGGEGNDKLFGGSGVDTLAGGRGRDVLEGGADPDLFVFAPGDGRDTIADFSRNDTLDLTAFGLAAFSDLRVIDKGEDLHIAFESARIILEGIDALPADTVLL